MKNYRMIIGDNVGVATVKIVLLLFLVFLLVGPASAATYYVKNGGNNSADGLSDDKAWETMAKVNGFSFSTGDDVYFKCDSVWEEVTLTVDWDGTSGNIVNIGAYYGDGIIGVSGGKPTFDGLYTYPSSNTTPFIYLNGRDYITVTNFKLNNSLGYHISLANAENINITNVDVDKAFNAGIRFYNVDVGNIKNCTVTDVGRKRIEDPGTDYPASIALIMGSSYITVKNNTVWNNYGEGIGAYHYNHDCVFENNICFANKMNIYVAHSNYNMTIRYNLCYGTTDDEYTHDGIGVASEGADSDGLQNNVSVHHNLVAYCYRGIVLGAYHVDSKIDNYFVYNNIVIDSRTFNFYNTEGPYVNSAVKNNIFWNTNDSIPEAIQAANTIDFDYNLWGKEPDADAKGPNDLAYGPPNISKTTGWDSLVADELDGSEFVLQSNSSAIDAGINLTSYNQALSSVSTWFDNIILSDQGDYGSGWEIGAFVYGAENATTNITLWSNNETNNNSLSITVDANQQVNFNATANQTITTWTWKKDTVDQSHNYDNITLNWTTLGEKSVTVTATNENGTSSEIEWTVTVENPGTWNYYKNLTINHSMVHEDLTNFSVLINLTDSDLADHAQADGDDIIFKTSDGVTQLDHEQESWNKTTGVYFGWVRVPAVNSTVNTTIRMYYNNSDAINTENPTGVWDDNYKAVYHMSETPPGTVYDSTSNNNDATTSGMDAADQVTGQIDGALDYDEINDYLYTSVDTSQDCGNNVTITTYHKRDDALIPATELQSLVVYRAGVSSSQYSLYWNEDERLVSWIYDGTWQSFVGTTQVQDTDPHRVDFVWNGTYAWTYIDGAQDNAGAFAYTPNDGSDVLWIGNDSYASQREFDGIIDETRISDIPRSAGWISTGWNNTEYPALFIDVGAEQGGGAPDTKFEYWDGAAWQENPEDYHLWFECFWITSGYPDGVAPNAEQTGSQHSLKITNNGTAAGIPKMKFNESSPAEVTVYVDDDYTVAGAVAITDTYQAVSTSLNAGENVTLSAWVNLTGLTSIWEYETEVIVE